MGLLGVELWLLVIGVQIIGLLFDVVELHVAKTHTYAAATVTEFDAITSGKVAIEGIVDYEVASNSYRYDETGTVSAAQLVYGQFELR